MTRKFIAGHTAYSADIPAYVSINREDEHTVSFSVRSSKEDGGTTSTIKMHIFDYLRLLGEAYAKL